ncbi:MFS transporter [Rhizobium sp. BE258]|uniref:MFS transporter n=1 Tax=Rhizobium sp. BE258 TaxID=2817722 RepID=UPI002864E3B6|nr:MFS transporter [Rhizobium sp. BE258]MDR7147741.1 MHS family proline/betaine transporter-like MFS transporter [Rhizobium sp. BE258]
MSQINQTPKKSNGARVIAAAMIGNALEFYDLFIYGFLAIIIAKVFFPAESEFVSLLITVGTFGASYIMRPLGAVVLGGYADRRGRKAGMMLTIWSMGLGTALIAFAPSYAAIGLIAPMLVILGKLLQGFSAGGEFGTSVSFVTEHAPKNSKGFYASFQVVGIGLATALAAGAGVALNSSLPSEAIVEWGWRLPFIFGLMIVPFGYFIRKGVDETPEFLASSKTDELPIVATMASAKAKIAFAIGVYSLAASTNYLLAVYIPTYAMRELGLSADVSFWGAFAFAIIQILLPPVIGSLSDHFGRLKFITAGVIMVAVLTYPMFAWMISRPEPAVYMIAISTLAVSVIVFQGAMPAFLAELFSGQTRTTGLALVHNLNFTLFGGMAPFICTLLIQETGSKFVPAYYVLTTVALALVSLIYFRSKVGKHSPQNFGQPVKST